MDAEIVVIGAGVIGLAVAKKMAEEGYSTFFTRERSKIWDWILRLETQK